MISVTNKYDEVIEIEVGTIVYFKCDVEQGGIVIKIINSYCGYKVIIENKEGFEGGCIGGETTITINAEDCLID